MLLIASGGKHDTRRTLAIKIVKMEILVTCMASAISQCLTRPYQLHIIYTKRSHNVAKLDVHKNLKIIKNSPFAAVEVDRQSFGDHDSRRHCYMRSNRAVRRVDHGSNEILFLLLDFSYTHKYRKEDCFNYGGEF